LKIINHIIIIYIVYLYRTEIKTFYVSMRTKKKKSKSLNEKIEIPACAPAGHVIRIPFYRGENKTLATRVKNGIGPHNNNNGIGCYNNNIVTQVNSVIIILHISHVSIFTRDPQRTTTTTTTILLLG